MDLQPWICTLCVQSMDCTLIVSIARASLVNVGLHNPCTCMACININQLT